MAQKQFTNYQDDILSFDLREAMLGILKPGRYCGFSDVSHVSTSGGVINVSIAHTTSGIRKGSKANPPVLSVRTGVAVTTQGMVIHENGTISAAITDGSAGGGQIRYDVIYLEHIYLDGTPGDNPATYGVTQGTPGSGVPAIDTTKRIPLIQVTIPSGASTFAELTFTPYNNELGDLAIGAELDTNQASILTIIGNRTYTEQNYIANSQALTLSLNALDMKAKDDSDEIVSLKARAIDSSLWGALTDITQWNVSINSHGLAPKLPNDVKKFLDGTGLWSVPSGPRIIMRTGSFATDVTLTSASPDANEINMQGIAASDADALLIRYSISATLAAGLHTQHSARLLELTGGVNIYLDLNNPGAGSASLATYGQFWVPCSATQKFWWIINSGKSSLTTVEIACVGWQTKL